MTHLRRTLTTLLLLLLIVHGTAPAQSSIGHSIQGTVAPTQGFEGAIDGWNSPYVLELIERARARRAEPQADIGLENYQAKATGHLYFFLDGTDSGERTLVRADQIALEVFWSVPGLIKQRIVGMRDESKLPNQMHYHLDHFTIVQDEFGDLIRLGDGDEVRGVLHPAAPNSDLAYDFRLADSTAIRLSGHTDPILVYEIEVRPQRTDQPAFIGSIYIDQATAAIVRLNFTFTPASYVDDRLDYIQVGLDNGLWDGRYWLPNEQTLEIRREVPVLDFPVGSVIRGSFRITDYEFNQDLPAGLFHGAEIIAAPRSKRESYVFSEGLYSALDSTDLTLTPLDISTLRREARRVIGREYLSGLPRLRFHIPHSSALLRYNRAEALYLGAGLSYATGSNSRLRVGGGYATGPGHLSLSTEWRYRAIDSTELWARTELNGLRDIGISPGLPGLLNTITSAGFGDDYLDPYFTTGLELGIETEIRRGWRAGLSLGYERQMSASLEDSTAALSVRHAFRPVRPIAEGALTELEIVLERLAPGATGFSGRLDLGAGYHAGEGYLRPTLEVMAKREARERAGLIELRGRAGFITGQAPPQRLFLLGGPATLPGYRYRSFAGDRFALLEVEATRDLLAPWLRGRIVGAAGWAGSTRLSAPSDWSAGPTSGIRSSLGVGAGLFYDILRIDLVHGLQNGSWQWVLSVSPSLAKLL